MIFRCSFATLILLPFLSAGGGGKLNLEEIRPPDVYERVRLVRAELDQLRAHMGRPTDKSAELPVTDAEPREVFFQALTLFRKANQMAFEQTQTRGSEPSQPDGKIQPGHVYLAVEMALRQIRNVKSELGIRLSVDDQEPDTAKTPSDVLRSIVQANRQLNLMLERRFAPSDVYQQVTVAMAYAERLIEQFSNVDSSIPDRPAFEANKIPSDVYERLLQCFEIVRQIAEQSGRQVLQLGRLDPSEMAQVAPSDVYDIASLIVSELAYIHAELPQAREPRRAYYPGRKFPSDVFQRVGILHAQLAQLQQLVETDPDWLVPRS